MAVAQLQAGITKESLGKTWEGLTEENRALVAKFVAFLEEEEANEEDRGFLADPDISESIRDAHERLERGDLSTHRRLDEVRRDYV